MSGTASNLPPADAAVALRGFPRRYRAALLPVDDPDLETKAMTIGRDGVSATELASDTARALLVLERAMHDVRVSDAPVLHPAVLDRSARHWDAAVTESPQSVLAQLDDVCASFADAIDATPTIDWTRTGTAAGTTVSALDIAREAVDTAATNLRRIDAVLASLD